MKPIGKYTVVREIGRGGMGIVFEGFDPVLDRPVAIKLLLAESDPARFLREAKAAARVNHPNCVTVFDTGTHDGHPFLVMELVTGASAAQLVARRGRLAWKNATRIIAAAARGLTAVHALDLVHRDIKPSNLLVTKAGVVKVADFGLVTSATRNTRSLTGDSSVGTPDYMSPEQCMSEPVDARTDVYALGATYFHLLTGKPPFTAEHHLQVMFAHCNNPVPDPRQRAAGVPDGCAAVALKALAKNPADRYQTMGEMLAALVACLKADGKEGPPDPTGEQAALDLPPEDEPPLTPPPHDASTVATGPVRRARPSRRKLLFALPAAAVVAGGAYFAAKAFRSRDEPDHGDEAPLLPLTAQTITVAAPVTAVAVSPDGRSLAVAMSDYGKIGGVQLFERHATGYREKWRKWPEAMCWGVAFSPTEPWLAVANQSTNTLEVWHLTTDETVPFPNATKLEGVRALAFSADGARLAAGTRTGSRAMVRLWDTTGKRGARDFAAPGKPVGSVRSVAFSPDGALVVAADDKPQPRAVVWDTASDNIRWSAGECPTSMSSAAFARSAPVFAVTHRTGVRCYSVPQFESVGKEIPTATDPETVALSPDGRLVAVKLDSRIVLYDTATGAPRHTYNVSDSAWSMTFTPDGKNLISGHTNRLVRVWVVPENL